MVCARPANLFRLFPLLATRPDDLKGLVLLFLASFISRSVPSHAAGPSHTSGEVAAANAAVF